jgi:arylsulfatase A-like enzyme
MMLSRRAFCGAASLVPGVRAQRSKQPNFVFLIADDHAGYVLGCDGNARAETPNLDRLASQGTRFSSHYCNSPVCTPSRQSFFTGQMPHAAGVTTLSASLDPTKPTIAKHMQKNGYKTAVFGKMHFNRSSRPGLYGFDELVTEREINQGWAREASLPLPRDTPTKKLPWQPFKDPARIWLNADNLPYPRQRDDMRSAYQSRRFEAYLDQNRDGPLAVWMSFMEPHSPFDFPAGAAKFRGDQFDIPEVGEEDGWQIPLIFRDLSAGDKRGITAAYYNSVRYLDQNIGRVIAALKKFGRYENTLIVYMADHGYCLGHHGRFEKHCGYDPALRVPLIFWWPGRVRQGLVADLTESVDVPHTILDLLGAPELPLRHGQSLRPYLENKTPSVRRDHIFSEYLENEEAFIRTTTYKLIYCSGKRERTDGYRTDNPTPGRYLRLYDLRSDPGEFRDVASKHPEIVERLKDLMLQRFRSTHPEAQQEPAGSMDEALDWYLRPRDAEAKKAA